jgi:hypothetical protein
MEIFSKEFREELFNQLEAITFQPKKEGEDVLTDYEIAKSMEDCMNNPNYGKTEKNKKK